MECDDENECEGGRPGAPEEEAKDGGNVDVAAYLRRMIHYAKALGNGGQVETESKSEDDDGESLVDSLARELLSAADPAGLRSSTPVPSAFLPDADDDEPMRDDDDDDDDDGDEMIGDDVDDEDYDLPYKFDYRRVRGGRPRDRTPTDALRSLLRSLAPVALDVAARAACRVLSASSDDGRLDDARSEKMEGGGDGSGGAAANVGERERLRAFVLFGFWIPLAPQLAPVISDLFGEFKRFAGDGEGSCAGCPLASLPFVASRLNGRTAATATRDGVDDRGAEAEAAVVASEAARELLDVYCNKRYEEAFARRWWDWDSCLFVLIHARGDGSRSDRREASGSDGTDADGDVVMDSRETEDGTGSSKGRAMEIARLIGGYSPETNAPHCADWRNFEFQMRWHASRAAGALFALRPLPLSTFLKSLGAHENDVPFVRHPWTIHHEDAACETNLMRGVGRVVLPKMESVKIRFGHDEDEAFSFEGSDSAAESERNDEMRDEHAFPLPSIECVRQTIPLHPSLIHAGRGILIPRRGSVASYERWRRSSLARDEPQGDRSDPSRSFVPTKTTTRNMSSLGIAMCTDPHPPPILVCGPPGSGKSSLVREAARLCSSFASQSTKGETAHRVNESCQEDELLELHVDEETDSKTLLGSYVATDIPGEFVWTPGPLTSAARSGRWVLIEDLDRCPEEIQASLLRLFEERVLPLGVGKEERCHPRFRLFGTCWTSAFASDADGTEGKRARRRSVASISAGGRRILHPNLWRKVYVDPLPFSELRDVGRRLHPDLPHSVADAVLEVLRKLDKSGRDDDSETGETNAEDGTNQRRNDSSAGTDNEVLGHGARHASVREYIKLLSRISAASSFEPGSEYATESQRLVCLAETVDVFAMSCPHLERRRAFISRIAAPTWGLTADAATRHVEGRMPSLSSGARDDRHVVEIGRARLPALGGEEDGDDQSSAPGRKRNFAETSHALRLMESVAVCASQNEPALLVGETGCGKTTLVQRLANLAGRSLLVQNLSLQTDSTDLLGGYKPLEMRHVARGVYDKFVDLFVSSFSRSQNAQFLKYVLNAFEKGDWRKLAQCFLKAAGMGENKMRTLAKKGKEATNLELWSDFRSVAERFERQRIASESGIAFLFTEGALVDAIRTGKWVLLDEINLASSETLQRLCGLLDDSHGSITLTEKGDAEAVSRHPDFRLFAAMNPATDAGKKDLPSSIRSRFTEIYVDELVDPVQLRSVAARYLDGVIATDGVPLEHSESVMSSVDIYLRCRLLSDQSLVDGGGQKPRYTMRTLCRALSAARNLIIQQRFTPQRAILEGFQLAFEGSLDVPSRKIIEKEFTTLLPKGNSHKERDHPGRRPDGRKGTDSFMLVKPFWIKSGKEEKIDWADPSASLDGKPKFVLTPSAKSNLRRLCQAVASGPWSILLEGPTSAGKTTLVEYLAARSGHKCVRINNHEHTDIQEYTGSYAADSNGKISFQEGILVQALRKGHWVILDELNLAPSEVLEALNRLLDDNRELYLPEINEAVKPHEHFRLFATQNPAGAYGGRKPLSRAFRNRFVEIHISDIPEDEMIIILEKRCGCPPSHAKLLVKVMKTLRQRRSRTGIFRGKDGLITPRDLLRWAGRGSSSKIELAIEGYMLLAERLRIDEEKDVVRSVIEKELKVNINIDKSYYGERSDGRVLLEQVVEQTSLLTSSGLDVNSIAPTQSIMRLLTLVTRCVKQKEPVLLVGDTGCGKTTVVQLLSVILQRQLTVVNCHASTETSDILGGFRPVRGRQNIFNEMISKAADLVQNWSDSSFCINAIAPPFIIDCPQSVSDAPSDSPKQVVEFLRTLVKKYTIGNGPSISSSHPENDKISSKKRRKLSNGMVDSAPAPIKRDPIHCKLVESTCEEIESLYKKYTALFEWADGPLVCSMKEGGLLLLDEMSLAEDAVLERLNSVLEPSRTLTLAEKGGEGPSCVHASDGSEIRAHEDFRIFATMNPGGDFGKRELSPALRSRFTEIWVPPVSDRSDIDLVLERSLSSAILHDSVCDTSILEGTPAIRRLMLDYFDWFNVAICDDPNSFCNDFKLSLRDVLSWARFIADVSLKNKILDQYSSYVHGASLMHLDGLGLGTGVSNHDAATTRKKAKQFLQRQISEQGAADVVGFQDELKGIEESMVSTKKCFGVYPFTIRTGDEKIPANLGFNLTAPTTGLNLRRVLRGMQLSKPILLEGSPGVGKTSLVSALAKASGHHLVRINLSEQTDISDLMGSDLPYSAESDNDGASSGASFRWCDGVLLKAIKKGDWVLLDELNLASQSVLEGLNSCLDHRASVYIPELGETFACPSTFRVFAAQNPLAQGGGRKGLPKSFLNRFTKVYIEALTMDDLFSIVAAQFPAVPKEIVERMIHFNEGVQRDIDSRLYGQHGSPWEFNLRDIFRWCELLISNDDQISSQVAAKYADMLYTQRLRTDHDRSLIKERFHGHFDSGAKKSHPKLEVTQNCVFVGTTSLERFSRSSHWPDVPTQGTESAIAQSLLRPMEAVACCIRMNWPCLLVGPPSSGKSVLLKTLADACNVHVETLAMSSSTDVTELIGCFEQTDAMGSLFNMLKSTKRIYCSVCFDSRVDTEKIQTINKQYWHVNEELWKLEHNRSLFAGNKTLIHAIDKLVECYESLIRLNPDLSQSFSDQTALVRRLLSSFKRESPTSETQSPFHWVDGILVQAMERGYWLHLENVNFCPSSVLDRLNPLMEFGGELVMTECGISDEDQHAKPRVIKPHPNFRLFLSMNPSSHGEVSRAMRNRCIEVCVLPPSQGGSIYDASQSNVESEVETLDAFTGLFHAEVRSHDAGQSMVSLHREDCQRSTELQEEPHSIKTLKDWGALFVGLLNRGMALSSLSASYKILYEVHENDACQLMELAPMSTTSALVTGISSRRDLGYNPPDACIAQGSRFLKVMTPKQLNHFASMVPQTFTAYKVGCKQQEQAQLRLQAICRLMEKAPFNDMRLLSPFFDGFCTKTAQQMKLLFLTLSGNLSSTGADQTKSLLTLSDSLDAGGRKTTTTKIGAQLESRISHLLEESVTYCQLNHIDIVPAPRDMSVVAVSYYMGKRRIDKSIVTCPITPLLFPLFQTIDTYLSTWQVDINSHCPKRVLAYKHLLLCRDRLWQCLKRTPYLGAGSNSQIGFDFTGFLIQYCWVKKSFAKFRICAQEGKVNDGIDPASLERNILLSFETIDDSMQESTGGSITSSDILWKRGGHPLLPSKLHDFEELSRLNDISSSCALTRNEVFGFTRMVSSPVAAQVDLKELMRTNHPSLFVRTRFYKELLGALSMAFWASTDETRGVSARDYSLSNAPKVLRKRFDDTEADFVANVHLATIDTSIRTVENSLDIDVIKSIVGENTVQKQNSNEFLNNVLTRFGEVQASQIGEIWCVSEEGAIIGILSKILRRHQWSGCDGIAENLRKHHHEVKSFINKSLAHSKFSMGDLRPYQTLLWVLESEATTDDILLHIMRSIMPRMIFSFHSHHWCNMYNDLDSICCHLVGPSLWNKEDDRGAPNNVNSSPLDQSARNCILASNAGPTRIETNVDRAAIFRLLRLPSSGTSTAYLTMENGDARKSQAKKLLNLFTGQRVLGSYEQQSEMIKYLLGAVFDAFQAVFGDVRLDINHLLDSSTAKTFDISSIFKNCENKTMKAHINNLVIPLIESVHAANESKEGSFRRKSHLGRAWIYLGLLRLNLLVPSSPIDPGRKPAAKVEQLDWFVRGMSSNLLSYGLHYGLSYGDFAPDSQSTKQLFALVDVAIKKRANQEKKIIERPPNAPPFHDLFREIHHFCKTVANSTSVLALVDSIENDICGTSFRSQEVNWQCSASSFCTRLSTVYSMYEDVTIPCVNEIRAIQHGLREMALNKVESPQTCTVVKVQDELLKYPLAATICHHPSKDVYPNVFKELFARFGVGEEKSEKQDAGAIHRSVQLAALLQLHIGLMTNCDNPNEANSIFSSLAHTAEETVSPEDKASDVALNEDEQEERELREYFPDHGAEFERIVASSLDEDDGEDPETDQNLGNCKGAADISQLSDLELSLVVSLHKKFFSGGKRSKIDDNTRIQAFVRSYEAAGHMSHLTQWMRRSRDNKSSLGSHILALALRCNVDRNAWSSTCSSDSISDFHSDPLSESARAELPLRNLLIRVGQLLRAFPGHAVLVALGQVVERVRQLDIQDVPLGKVMSGLEVILRRAQDWEQHASQHVTLGNPLKDVSSLVATWRKLELQSWSNLLTIRENRRGLRAKRHWSRIYSLIHKSRESPETCAPATKPLANYTCSPSWVWKGHKRIFTRLGADVDTKSMDDLAKVLDTFILTSNIAEFWARLDLIKSFANELTNECKVNGNKRLPLARLLRSLCNYYSRFEPLLLRTKNKFREPIEKRLKDEVKLAKWDEQSYYSLAASSEKNHRKLMKFLREYDELLDTTVLSILELNFAEGIRSANQTQAGDHEPVTTVPSDSSLFPEFSRLETIDKNKALPPSKMHALSFLQRWVPKKVTPNNWSAAGLTDSVDKYVLRVEHYTRKMESIIPRNNTHAHNAATIAAELTDAVFSRIGKLREPKTTKQVKQRALVDLFKCLKEQGYSSMKWSVPSNVRAPHDMLQLPVPLLYDISSWDKSAPVFLEKGESYFHRCQVEITRLRFEISMFGSQYMSQREMAMMQGYSEYILFVICQQRGMIAIMIQSVCDIESLLQSYDSVVDSMPNGQEKLSNDIKSFEKHLLSLIEGLHQVILLIKESSTLVEGEGARGRMYDILAILTSCASTLEEIYVPCAGKMPITSARIHQIRTKMTTVLGDSKSNLLSCVKTCGGIFPATIFDSCIDDLNQSLSLALSFKQEPIESDKAVYENSEVLATIRRISSLVQNTLIAVQSIVGEKDQKATANDNEVTSALCQNHKNMLEEMFTLRLEQMHCEISELSGALIGLHDDASTNGLTLSLCTRATISSFSLVNNALQLSKARLGDALLFYQKHSKFLYILLRVFRALVAKGFCSDDVSDGGEGNGEGGSGEMKFEDDVEGTGMGEGDGKKDVTDELENEEQLLGLKDDDNQEASSPQERKELKEDEVDKGMEMEADFEGEKYDLPDQPEDHNDDTNSENEEEVDREMGDGEDPNEQVVDEKMWDPDEDDLQDLNQEEEKFEENSKMTGEQLEDEMRTGDGEDNEDSPAKEDGAQEQISAQKESPQDESVDNDQMDEIVNDDTEDKYEDKHDGVDVRNEDQNASGDEDDGGVDLDDLNLDDDNSSDTGSNGHDPEEEDKPDDEENNEAFNDDMDPDDAQQDDSSNAGEDEDKEMEPIETVGQDGVGHDETDDPIEPDDNEDIKTSLTPPPKSHYDSNEALGIAAEDGQDTVKETNEENSDPHETANEGGAAEENSGSDENPTQSKGAGGSGNDGNWQRGKDEEQRNESQSEAFDNVPNPFRSPGDAEKFWHKKLDMIDDSQQDQEKSTENVGQDLQEEDKEKEGQFEYTKESEDYNGQVLGIAEDDQAKQLEDNSDDDFETSKQESGNNNTEIDGNEQKQEKRDQSQSSRTDPNKENQDHEDNARDSGEPNKQIDDQKEEDNDPAENSIKEDILATNRAITDRTPIQDLGPDVEDNYNSDGDIQEMDYAEGITLEDIQRARARWQTIQSDTNNLSRRLCEKLRLVMEPLVATKLRGDYRTGKRVNMKRIIGYIASGYRKDKIWLRRTKPAKRDYRVLIAVDDSESMQKSQAGDMALKALATLANGMSQLEIGQLGIASFGEDMKLLHPFDLPFTSESGVNIVSNFTFEAKRTKTALCVESSIAALEGAHGGLSSMQLVFMISDGRIERDSRSKLRRLIRQMAEKNMLMVMIIVEGEEQGLQKSKSESILNMKEVSFVNGKPKIKHFIEDYPFPYYLVVGDLSSLPEILGDALRQWFEMLAQMQAAV